jgi:hypothetical protein
MERLWIKWRLEPEASGNDATFDRGGRCATGGREISNEGLRFRR